MRLHALRFLCLLAALGMQASPQAQTPTQTPTQSPAQTPAQAPLPTSAPAANVNTITQTAVQQGVLNCASRINQLTNFLGFNAQAGALLMLPAGQPDQRIFPVAMEVPAEGSAAYVTATFAPNQANGCGAAYDAVLYWPQSCEAVATKQFTSLKRIGQLKTSITVLDGGVSMKVFLMPAGSGCVSIKKEVLL